MSKPPHSQRGAGTKLLQTSKAVVQKAEMANEISASPALQRVATWFADIPSWISLPAFVGGWIVNALGTHLPVALQNAGLWLAFFLIAFSGVSLFFHKLGTAIANRRSKWPAVVIGVLVIGSAVVAAAAYYPPSAPTVVSDVPAAVREPPVISNIQVSGFRDGIVVGDGTPGLTLKNVESSGNRENGLSVPAVGAPVTVEGGRYDNNGKNGIYTRDPVVTK